VCHGCKEDIAGGSQYVNVNDKLFHTEHFTCAGDCKEALAGKPYLEKDDEFYCEDDYLNKFHPKCGGCAKPLVGEYVTALEKQW
jgi:paxillin